ncbi:putative Ig domain-containing protein, partial [Leptolyngbya sp. AN02str]|uniref:putative Ig domain-containing protein n=1 Tax=Leptolyngbya sp. AN02str TaxID=3423363 RepID=UPI003D312AAB
TALPAWLTFNPSTRAFSGTPTNANAGSFNVRVIARDSQNATTSTTFGLTVNAVNNPPIVNQAIAAQTIAQNSLFNFQIPLSTFKDLNGDPLTYTVTRGNGTPLPSWLKFDAATRTLRGTPKNADVGALGVRVTAIDPSKAGVSTTFGLTVTNVNDAPIVLKPIPNQQAIVAQVFTYQLGLNTFVDPDIGDTLTYRARLGNGQPLPGWLQFRSQLQKFVAIPPVNAAGNWTIQVIATDKAGASRATSFNLAIASDSALAGYNVILGTLNADSNIQGTNSHDFIRGFAGADRIYGNGGNDRLFGNNGNDLLVGGLGRDLLKGGAGLDTLTGGGGIDTFALTEGLGYDVITDFEVNVDRIRIPHFVPLSDIRTALVSGSTEIYRTSTNDLLARVQSILPSQLPISGFIVPT